MKLRVQIPLLIVLVVLAACASLIIAVQLIVPARIHDANLAELSAKTEANAELISARLDAQLVQLYEIANRIRIRTMDWEIVRQTLLPEVERLDCLEMGLVYPDGTAHYAVDGVTSYLGDREYVRQAFAGKRAVSDVLISRITNAPVVLLAAPVFQSNEPDAPVIGVLFMRNDAMFLADMVNAIRPGFQSQFAMLTNNEGTIVAHPDSALVMDQFNPIIAGQTDPGFKALGDIVAQALREKSGITSFVGLDGEPRISTFTGVPGYSWTLFVNITKKDFDREMTELNSIFFAIGIACLIFGIIIALIIGRVTSMPILRIVRAVEDLAHGKIAEGNLSARIEGSYRNEFDDIKDAVNSMAAEIEIYMTGKLHAERKVYESELAKERAEAAREAVMSGISYASKIQKNLLPADSELTNSFSDHSVIWEPRDVVGGDIYWLKKFDAGTALCVCDCTGHGTPGALLTMLVVSALEGIVKPDNCHDTAYIIWRLEQRLVDVFSVNTNMDADIKDGCDLAVLFVAKDGSVNISSGNIHVFVCDGREVRQIKGQNIYIGEGRLKGKDDVETINIPAKDGNKFYIASDGLFDQIGGGRSEPYGYRAFRQIILENHNEKQSLISDRIWSAFEEYRGAEPRVDDFELIAFKP
uniref:Tetratricopeptide repeat domain protein n=1 Tax=uncultured bacterium contig00014 TaxID=1181505 RepID=A0A806KJJ0_9BACT|nr:tetratricopeptide repeat domain protein [uncultured bacterium contig00014]